MYKTPATVRKWETLLRSLKEGQREMLELKPEKAGRIFEDVFDEQTALCREGIEDMGAAVRGTTDFLVSSQLKLIQKTAHPLNKTIEKLPQMSDRELISLFEKQIRLKKIIRKHIETLGDYLPS